MRGILVLVCVVMASSAAYAQYGNPYPFRNTAVDTALATYANKQIIDLAIERQNGKAAKKSKPAVKHQPLSASDFKAEKGRPAIDAFFARTKLPFIGTDDMRAIVDRTFVAVEGQLRKNNVASAIAFVIGISLAISRNVTLQEDALHELVANVNDRLAMAPAFKKLKASERQAMYDSLILTGAIILTLNVLGETDEGRKADAMEMANAMLLQLGEK